MLIKILILYLILLPETSYFVPFLLINSCLSFRNLPSVSELRVTSSMPTTSGLRGPVMMMGRCISFDVLPFKLGHSFSVILRGKRLPFSMESPLAMSSESVMFFRGILN